MLDRIDDPDTKQGSNDNIQTFNRSHLPNAFLPYLTKNKVSAVTTVELY